MSFEINMCLAVEVKIVPAVLSTNGLISEYPSEAPHRLGQILKHITHQLQKTIFSKGKHKNVPKLN